MKSNRDQAASVDEYIDGFPPKVRTILRKLRKTIRAAAPGVTERISYRMPAFEWNGVLVWFGAYEKHVGFYPTAGGIAAFKRELSGFKSARGSVQFPIDGEVPYDLVTQIVKYRVAQNEEKLAARETKPKRRRIPGRK